MIDSYGRTIDYIRISVTDRCNLRCVYCMPEDGIVSVPHEKILTYDELIHFVKVLVALGIKKIKLTGGEPLVRKNLSFLVHELKKISGIEEVTLTTNGILLKDQAKSLIEAGIDAINISLDTLDSNHYRSITRGGNVADVLDGIRESLKYKDIPIKINCVPNDITDGELLDIALLAKENNLHVRFIELMPIGSGKKVNKHQVNDESSPKCILNQEDRIKEILEKRFGTLDQFEYVLGNGPSKYYSVPGFLGKIGFISALSHQFCGECNRIRLTAEGYLKTCLQYDIGVNIFPLLRENEADEKIAELVQYAIQNKPKEHGFLKPEVESGERKSMSQIGG